MPKRKTKPGSDDDGDDSTRPSEGASVGQQTSFIGNKLVRSQRYQKLKHEQKKKKRIERKKRQKEIEKAEELGLPAPARQEPKARFFVTSRKQTRPTHAHLVIRTTLSSRPSYHHCRP